VNDPFDASSPPPARRRSFVPWLLLLALLGLAGWRGWAWWQAERMREAADAGAAGERVLALEERLAAVRRDQRSQAARLQQADATNRVLRDELLGISQRAALLEESVAQLADAGPGAAVALRLDEVELLLGMARARLEVAGDLDGARRAYALAAGLLAEVADPRYLDLRQALAQERAAIDGLQADPARIAGARLDGLVAMLEALPTGPAQAAVRDAPWWRRLLSRLVEVRPSGDGPVRTSGDRALARAALRLEFAIARAALERRDAAAWTAALERADALLASAWPSSPALRTSRQELRALRALPLRPSLPVLGSTLEQLRSRRAAR
jgi:uroporphyrin-3 C-methyltransferase